MGTRHGPLYSRAAAAYLGLKVGQVFEAAIPIAIIAVGISSATKRKGALGENVMIQSIGACSGVIVAGGHLYPASPLHPAGKISGNDGQLHADVHQLLAGWCAGHPVPDSPSVNISSATNMANIPSPKPLPVRKCLFPARKAEARQSHCFLQD